MKNLSLVLFAVFSVQFAVAQNDTILNSQENILVDIVENDRINTGSEVSPEMATEFLEHHNMARNEVGVENIKWSNELASIAQDHANMLAFNNCSFSHSGNRSVGENIFGGVGIVFTALDASKSWYTEKEDYTYSNSDFNHYTQMIWKATTEVGVGIAQCEDGFFIIVANYTPRGNMLGSYPY